MCECILRFETKFIPLAVSLSIVATCLVALFLLFLFYLGFFFVCLVLFFSSPPFPPKNKWDSFEENFLFIPSTSVYSTLYSRQMRSEEDIFEIHIINSCCSQQQIRAGL